MKYFLLLLPALFLQLSAAPLSGTKTIGPASANYPSITAALAAIRTQTLGGELVLELQPGYLSSVETFPLDFSNLPTSDARPLTLRPQSGASGLSISSYGSVVNLNKAQFVTFDGRPGGTGTAKELTIAGADGSAVNFLNGASSNTLRYLILKGADTSYFSGTVVFSSYGENGYGNNDNTIDSCDIRDGTGTPTNAIYSSSYTQSNSGNTISNCNIFNFHTSDATDAAGVRLEDGNTGWNITGNSFYQTASRAGVPGNVRAIFINCPSGNNFNVTGNFVGGSAPNAGGAAWTTTGTATGYVFQGIRLIVGNTTASCVRGNTIRNINWTTRGFSNYNTIWSGISVPAGNSSTVNVTGNTIGSPTGTDSISVTTSDNLGNVFGIVSENENSRTNESLFIADNTVGSITTNASLIGIQSSRSTNSITGNLVGSTTTANSLNATTAVAAAGATPTVTGILSMGNSASITGNTVANLNNGYAGNSDYGQILGIVNYANVDTVTGNTVRNLSTASQNQQRGRSASVLGILASQYNFSNSPNVSGNVVHSLSNTAASAGVEVVGIFCTSQAFYATSVISGNLVHSLSIASTSDLSRLYGVYLEDGRYTVKNNMVRVGIGADGTNTAGAATVAGIFERNSYRLPRDFYHNSVFVGGWQTAGGSNTSAYFCDYFSAPTFFATTFSSTHAATAARRASTTLSGSILLPHSPPTTTFTSQAVAAVKSDLSTVPTAPLLPRCRRQQDRTVPAPWPIPCLSIPRAMRARWICTCSRAIRPRAAGCPSSRSPMISMVRCEAA